MEELKRKLDEYAEAYFNAQPLISDEEFDRLKEYYEMHYGPYTKVGAPVRGEKTPLPHYLCSLDKPKKEDLERWLRNNPGPYTVEDKVDGMSYLVIIRNNKVTLLSRGQGVEGMDTSHIANDVYLPKLDFDITVRCEMVLYRNDFEAIKGEYKSARSMLTGIINSKDSYNPEYGRYIHLLAFRIIESSHPVLNELTPGQQIAYLQQLGFETPWAGEVPTLTVEELDATLAWRKENAPYDMDGLVIYREKIIEYIDEENPKDVIAYKGVAKGYVTTVKEVEWNASMYRKLKPTVIYDPVEHESGATLTRATAHNAKFVLENGVGPGAIISVTREGDTIPYISCVFSPGTAQLPQEATFYNGTDYVMYDDNDDVLMAKMEHFVKVLKIDDLGPERIRALFNYGVKSTLDLINVPTEYLIQIPGFGKELSRSLPDDIRKKITDVPLYKVMAASTVFENFGTSRLRKIVNGIPDVLYKVEDPTLASAIQRLGGFNELAYSFVRQLPIFVNWLKERSPPIKLLGQAASTQGMRTLEGMKFVFSGFRDTTMEDEIMQRGGTVTTSVSDQTTAVIMKNINDVKGKARTALNKGKTLISREDMKRYYLQ